jgi:hypothetical protein
MLWKYKKVYQETTEEVEITPPPICKYVGLVSIIYTGMDGDPTIFEGSWNRCESNRLVPITKFAYETDIRVFDCVREGSFVFDGVVFTQSGTFLTPYWSVTINFEDCINN